MGYGGPITSIEQSAEELLLEFERTGRPEPFEEIVRRYAGMVFHVCHRITRDRHDAEDATQAVFAALAVGRKKESGEVRAIGSWLRQVAKRVSLDMRRGKTRRQQRETARAREGNGSVVRPEEASAGLNGLHGEEVKQLVKEELEKLPVKYRLPLVLHYFGGMEQDEMAQELGIRPGTLRVRLHRGRQMLAKRLAKRGIQAGLVVLAVGAVRAVQCAVTDSMGTVLGSHASGAMAANGVMQAASTPVMMAQGVALTKVKISMAVVLVAACVVRAGAEVYQYIRPLQLQFQMPAPLNLDRVIRPMMAPVFGSPQANAGAAKEKAAEEVLVINPPRMEMAAVVPVMPVRSVEASVPPPARVVALPPVVPMTSVTPAPRYEIPSRSIATPSGVAGGANETAGGWLEMSPSAGAGGPSMVRPVAIASVTASPPSARVPSVVVPSTVGMGPQASTNPVPPIPEQQPISPPVVALAAPIVLKATPPSASVQPPIGPFASLSGDSVGSTSSSNAAAYTTRAASSLTFTPHAAFDAFQVVAGMSANTPPTPAPTFTRNDTTLEGYGVVPPTEKLDNSGKVIASGGTDSPVLDLTQVASITNSVDNPASGANGWYARGKATLMLPAMQVAAGTSERSWGESESDETPDLVNSVRATFHDVATPGTVLMALVGRERPGIPALPAGDAAVSVFSYDSTAAITGGVDVLIRYDALDPILLSRGEDAVKLLAYHDGWQQVMATEFDPAENLIGGHFTSATYFAVAGGPATFRYQSLDEFVNPTFTLKTFRFEPVTQGVPEPAIFGILVAAGGLVVSRRRRLRA